MPFRTARRIRRRPRRIVRKRRFVKRIPRTRFARSNNAHFFKQQVELANVVVTAGNPAFFTINHSLSDLPQVGTFSSLYDQYRILAVKVVFIPQYTVSYASTTPLVMTEIYTALDFDGAPVPTAVNTINQYTTCRRQLFNRPHVRYYHPSALSAVTNGGNVITGSVNIGSRKWFDIGYPSNLYYGLIGAVTASQSAAIPAQLIRCQCVYYIQCRNVR